MPRPDAQIEDVELSVRNKVKQAFRKYYLVAGILLLAWFGSWAIAIFYLHVSTPEHYLGSIVVPIFVLSWVYAWLRAKVLREFMMQFAAQNGYKFSKSESASGLEGALFKIGHDQVLEDVVSGNYKGYPIRLFVYKYVVGYGKNQQHCESFVMEVDFGSLLPHVMLSSRSQSFTGVDILALSLSGSMLSLKSKIGLEPPADQFFELYSEPGFEQEALEIFTPELLARLVALPKKYTMEFVGNKLFVYSKLLIYKRDDLNYIYATFTELAEHIGPYLKRMSGDVQSLNEAYEKN